MLPSVGSIAPPGILTNPLIVLARYREVSGGSVTPPKGIDTGTSTSRLVWLYVDTNVEMAPAGPGPCITRNPAANQSASPPSRVVRPRPAARVESSSP